MKNEIIYIKAEQNTKVSNKKVFLRDIVKLYSTDTVMADKLNGQVVMMIKANEDTKYVFSILKIIELISKEYPGVEVINMGETDFIVEYKLPGKPNKTKEYIKAAIVCLVVFFGAAFSIMTFNTDVSVGDVFDKAYGLVLGQGAEHGRIVEIAYSIGLPIGIIVFYNHFSRFKIHTDPTPIQVQMRSFEEDVNKAVIQNSSREGKTLDAN